MRKSWGAGGGGGGTLRWWQHRSGAECSFTVPPPDNRRSKASFTCKESWGPPSLCTIDVEGLSGEGGFEAYCAATECRL